MSKVSVLSWVKTFLNSPISFRKATKARVLAQLETVGSGNNKDMGERKAQGKIIRELVSQSNMECIGVLESISYLKIEGDKDELPFIWEHKAGNPGLLYYDKKSGVVLLVAPGISFNDSVINRFDENKKINMRGITGP